MKQTDLIAFLSFAHTRFKQRLESQRRDTERHVRTRRMTTKEYRESPNVADMGSRKINNVNHCKPDHNVSLSIIGRQVLLLYDMDSKV